MAGRVKGEVSAAGTTADLLRRTAGKPPKDPVSAVIVAAGASLRMAGIDKQFAEVKGIPVLARTLLAFERCGLVSEIVVVARAEEVTAVESLAVRYGISKLSAVTAGGETRALSVKNGFERIDGRAGFVAIHDGARCLITPAEIEKVIRAARRYNAATAAYPAIDTVKIADRNGFIRETPPRKYVYAATTPQIFNANLYRAALATVPDHADLTDDNQLIEKLPFPVKLVDCGRENIKITYKEDLALAEFYLDRREKGEAEK